MQNMLHDTELLASKAILTIYKPFYKMAPGKRAQFLFIFLATHPFTTPKTPLPFIMIAAAVRLWLEHQEQFCLPSEWLSFSAAHHVFLAYR